MSEHICTLSTGDRVYFYDKSIVIFFQGPRKVLSTSVYNGGYHEDYKAVYNYDGKQGSGMPCEMLADTYVGHMTLISERLAIDPQLVTGMATAASMENAVVETMSYQNLTVTAIVTGGIETNGGRVGDPATYFHPVEKPGKAGTINIMLVLDTDMPPGTMARALVTCTEAKTAAIQELLAGSNYSNGLATGSGTDQTIIVANPESKLYLEGAGKHDKLGELIGKTVKKAVKAALHKQAGLNPAKQHDVFRRLKRFGILPNLVWQEYQEQYAPTIKPVYLLAIEELGKEKMMLTYTSLYVHLLDQFLWQLIDREELELAGQAVLDLLAEHYATDRVTIDVATVEGLLVGWKQLFNSIVASKIA